MLFVPAQFSCQSQLRLTAMANSYGTQDPKFSNLNLAFNEHTKHTIIQRIKTILMLPNLATKIFVLKSQPKRPAKKYSNFFPSVHFLIQNYCIKTSNWNQSGFLNQGL